MRSSEQHSWRALLFQGVLYTSAAQLGSISTVIPFMAHELGWPQLIVSSLFPLYTVGAVMGAFWAPRSLAYISSIKALLIAACGLSAVAIFINALGMYYLPNSIAPYVLACASMGAGIASGTGTAYWFIIAFQLLSPQKIASLGILESGAGAAITLAVSFISARWLTGDNSAIADGELLWAATIFMLASAVACTMLHPTGSREDSIMHISAGLPGIRSGLKYFFSHRWARRYIATSAALSSVTLTVSFFSLYAASTEDVDGDDADVMLIFISVGILAGIPVWYTVKSTFGARGMLFVGASIGMTAAFVCLIAQTVNLWPKSGSFGIVMVLSALGAQAISPGLQAWMAREVSVSDIAVLAGFSQALLSGNVAVMGFAFISMAQSGAYFWPALFVLLINLMALIAVSIRDPGSMPGPDTVV